MSNGSDKPPIEQVMQDLNNMLSNIGKNKSQKQEGNVYRFGKGGGGDGGGKSPNLTGANGWNMLWVILAVLLMVWGIISSYYTVNVSEVGVVTRFQAYHITAQPGFHFKLPFGVDQVTLVRSKEVLIEEFGFRARDTQSSPTQYNEQRYLSESLMLTGDLNVANVEWTLQYRIADPWKFLFHVRDVKKNIRDISISIMRRVVGDRPVSDVLTTGRVEIADEAKKLTQDVLNRYDMGIQIKQIILQDVNPPDAVKDAFNEVNSAKQEQEQTINQAEQQYNKIIPEARGKAEKKIADAKAYSTELVNNAMGDANKFTEVLKAYKEAPVITRQRMYLETMEKVYSSAEKLTIVDPDVKGVLPIFGKQTDLSPVK